MNVKNHIFPIEYLDEIREAYKDAGIKIRVRYRGPRRTGWGRKGRPWDTLRKDAYGFTVYKPRYFDITKRAFPLFPFSDLAID